MMPSFSLAALTALELAPLGLIDVAAACGYDHVGLRLLPAMPGGVAYPLMEDHAALRETIARLDATGVTVADLEVVAIRPETEIAAFSAFFEAGARLRAKHVLVAAYDPRPGPVCGSLCRILQGCCAIWIDRGSGVHAVDDRA
jgi:hypothetical protein